MEARSTSTPANASARRFTAVTSAKHVSDSSQSFVHSQQSLLSSFASVLNHSWRKKANEPISQEKRRTHTRTHVHIHIHARTHARTHTRRQNGIRETIDLCFSALFHAWFCPLPQDVSALLLSPLTAWLTDGQA